MKENNAKGSQRERSVTHKEKPIKLTEDFSAEPLQARRVGANIQHPKRKEFLIQNFISSQTKLHK